MVEDTTDKTQTVGGLLGWSGTGVPCFGSLLLIAWVADGGMLEDMLEDVCLRINGL